MYFTKAVDAIGTYYIFTGNMYTTFRHNINRWCCPQFPVIANNIEEAKMKAKELITTGVYTEINDIYIKP